MSPSTRPLASTHTSTTGSGTSSQLPSAGEDSMGKMREARARGMCPSCAHGRIVETSRAFLAQLWMVPLATTERGSDQQKRPPANRRALSEPPKGIEPLTYSLRASAAPRKGRHQRRLPHKRRQLRPVARVGRRCHVPILCPRTAVTERSRGGNHAGLRSDPIERCWKATGCDAGAELCHTGMRRRAEPVVTAGAYDSQARAGPCRPQRSRRR